MTDLPLPPPELRALVGPLEDRYYDNPAGVQLFPHLPASAFDFVFDWGCGCGRLARQLIQQRPPPRRYLGIDLHRGMVQWCRANLASHAPSFGFEHHDVMNLGLNPGGAAATLPFPVGDGEVSLFLAWSVFTHVVETAASFYLHELARVLRPDGIALTTWFLFDKTDFPMMQEFQNALYINDVDPTNAVIFDQAWLRAQARRAGLVLHRIVAPAVRGFQWQIELSPASAGRSAAEFPRDAAPVGLKRPPLLPASADKLGL